MNDNDILDISKKLEINYTSKNDIIKYYSIDNKEIINKEIINKEIINEEIINKEIINKEIINEENLNKLKKEELLKIINDFNIKIDNNIKYTNKSLIELIITYYKNINNKIDNNKMDENKIKENDNKIISESKLNKMKKEELLMIIDDLKIEKEDNVKYTNKLLIELIIKHYKKFSIIS